MTASWEGDHKTIKKRKKHCCIFPSVVQDCKIGLTTDVQYNLLIWTPLETD